MAVYLSQFVNIACLTNNLRELVLESLLLFIYLHSIDRDGLCELSHDHEARYADKSSAEHLLSFTQNLFMIRSE